MGPSEGRPFPLGVSLDAEGANVAVASAHATTIELCLFDGSGEAETARIRLPARTGDVFHGHIAGLVAGTRYGFRAHGPWAPEEGHRFNASKLLIDPYALQLDRIPHFDASMIGADAKGRMDDADSGAAMPKAVITEPGTATTGQEITPWALTTIYELHVRGFTMAHPDIPEDIRGTFAGLAHPAAIAHLTSLGVTAVEVLPPCAWIEERHLAAQGLTNHWGYNSIAFLAPDPRLAPGGWAEVRACVQVLADAGIETLVDIVLNHTGEGDAHGPILSLRGLDNATYFRVGKDGVDVNDTGCGNTLAMDRPVPLRLAMDCLRAWAIHGGVHGFRFDLAPVLARGDGGFAPDAPLLQAIEQDPVLSTRKMIAEPWDAGWGGYQLGRFPHRWGEWNDRFRDDTRRFWRGEPGRLGALATRLSGSADIFAPRRTPSRSVNFVVAHDGFTLADLVSYDRKHNEANGEFNRDGTTDNLSWNNGVEGVTDDAAITASRRADQRALLATLLLARGTPMLPMGAEFGQTQGGNNNAYAQDNATSWLDWARADADLLDWTRLLVALRRDHAGFHADEFLDGNGDVQWLRPDGAPLAATDWNAEHGDALVMVLGTTGRLALAFNRARQPVPLTLPASEDRHGWVLLANSADPASSDAVPGEIPPRSVLAFLDRADATRTGTVDHDVLDQLSRAAGVASEWWETHGTHHRVSDDTKRSILRAMQMPAETTAQARSSLRQLVETRDLRPMPLALVRRAGERVTVPMTLAAGLAPRSEWLTIAHEDGTLQRVRAGAADAVLDERSAADGTRLRHWRVDLPELPIGRHRVWRDDAPEQACGLTIAPHACYLPPSLVSAHRRWGVSAQLYTVVSDRDQGIGDFSTLRDLAMATRTQGGAIVGLNPMHAMFGQQRERASPYQPSDRRFLDPIYLDLPEVDGPEARALSAQPAVGYRAVWALKQPALERRFASMQQGTPDPALAGFIAEGGVRLHRFALFEAIAESFPGQSWHVWPQEMRHPDSPAVAEFARAHPDRVYYHQYLQFLCERQLDNAAREGGLEIGLVRDLAVGCAPDGAEAWALAEMVGQSVSIGAPPDPFSAEGQVWGLPPPNPLLMPRNNYAEFTGLLAANMRHAGGLRIDHALGLARLFWVPDGARGADGTYVAYPLDDLLGQIALESHRAKCLVIGEDLGTTPDGLREALLAHDMLSYRVLLLEREGRGFVRRQDYPARAIACVSTHDLPTFTGWREGADITERVALGQRAGSDATSDQGERDAEVAALEHAIGEAELAGVSGNLMADAHAYVAATAADLVYAQADDLAGENQAVNLPGTDLERPNWRRRLRVPLSLLFDTDEAKLIVGALQKARPSD